MKQQNKIVKLPNTALLPFYKFTDRECRSFSNMMQNYTNIDIESPKVKERTCYKKIMEISDFTIPYSDNQWVELLSAMISKSPQLTTLSCGNAIITKEYKKVLANLAKSKLLHTLYINFDNMTLGTEIASGELASSNSLKAIYIKFKATVWHTTDYYCKIIAPLFKISSLKNLTIQLDSKQRCEKFAEENDVALNEMLANHFQENFDTNGAKTISENFFPSFIALKCEGIPVEVVGTIAKLYVTAPTLNIEYSYYNE